MAEASLRQGNPQQSVELLAPDPPSQSPVEVSARRKIIQGEAFCRLSRPHEAELVFGETGQLIPPARRDLQAELALARGRCALSGNRTMATQYFTAAVALAHGGDRVVEASALANIGYLLLQDERYDQAIDTFNEVLSLTDSPFIREKALGNLGFSYAQLGDWKRAISFSQQAERMAAEIKNNGDREKWLNDLGLAHFALWELSEAENSYLQALSLAQQLHDAEKAALCFHNLALLALRRHDVSKAEEYRRRGEALKVEHERLHLALDAARIAAARKQFAEAERLFRELLPRTKQNAVFHSMVQRDLGRVYWQANKNAQADRTFREGIATAEKAVAEFKRPEYRMSFMDQDAFYDSYIQFLVAQGKPSEALKISERSRAQVLAAAVENEKQHDPLLSVQAIQTLSKRRKQVILTYSMTDEKTFLWVTAPSRFKLFELPGHRELSQQIDAFNREIQEHRNIEDSSAGLKLYRTLIQPAEALVPKGSSVIIIPSKLLSLVNFEALIVPGPQPHYWIDDVDVQVTGSLALLGHARSAPKEYPPGTKEMLALGAPVEASKEFPTLKHAPEEMQRVRSHFPVDQETIISGKEATPVAYRASDPGSYRFIHLDTHGVASDLSPLDSAIILSPGADNSYKLYAREIKDIPLHADLVTISACYGAGTRWYQGEGIVGLAWAFLRAGAHQVIAALWEVDDASSPQLMDDFYGELSKGKPAAEALRAAKLKMLHSTGFYRHPYYWASLQLYTGS